MKRIALLVVCIAIGVAASTAQVRFGGGAHGGLSFASFPQPVNQFFGVGFGGGAHADMNILPFLGLRLNFDYTTFASDKSKLKEQFSVTDGNGNPVPFTVEGLHATILGITANAIGKIPTGSSVTPYGLLGMGLHIGSNSDLKIISNGNTLFTSSSESSTNFGLNFGAGSEFGIGGRSKLFVEAKYVLIFTSGNSTGHIPVTVGVTF
jgi:opacity protein-like surface antigen